MGGVTIANRLQAGREAHNKARADAVRAALPAARLLRREFGYSLKQIASVAGCSESTVCRWLKRHD